MIDPDDQQKKKRGGGRVKEKTGKTDQVVEAEALIRSMDTTKNLFSQLSAQYQQKKDVNDEKTKQFIQKQAINNGDALYHQFDEETQRILHGLGKKSSTTKIKAFCDLKKLLQDRDEEFYSQFGPSYVNIYKQLAATEHDRKVLEESSYALQQICQKARKSLQSKFKDLFPMWFIVMNDLNPEVSRSALMAFEVGFPKEKWGQAIILCQDGYFTNLRFYLNITLKQVQQENIYADEGQTEFIYERLISSSLQSIITACTWIQSIIEENKLKFISELMRVIGMIKPTDQKKFTPLLLQILDQNRKRSKIESSVISALTYLMNEASTRQTVLDHLDIMALKTIHLLDNREISIQQSLWKGYIVSLFQAMTQKQLQQLDQGMLESKLFDVINNCASGVGRIFYEQLTILLAYLPQAHLNEQENEEQFKMKLGFMKKFLQNIMNGLQHEESRFFSEHIINCFFECLYFICTKRIQPYLENRKQIHLNNLIRNMLIELLKSQLVNFLKGEITNAYNHVPYKQFPASLGQFFEIITKDNSDRQMMDIYEQIINDFLQIFNTDVIKNQVWLMNYFNLLDQILQKITQKSGVFDILSKFVLNIFRTIEKQFIELSEYPTINDYDKIITCLNNLLHIWGLVCGRKERSKILQAHSIELLNNGIERALQNLIKLIFKSIEYCTVPQRLLELAHLSVQLDEMYQEISIFYNKENPQTNKEIYIQKLDEYKCVQVQSNLFKLRWLCLFMRADSSVGAIFYNEMLAVKGDAQMEWATLEKYINCQNQKRLNKENKEFSNQLVIYTLNVKNLSLKIFIPSLINQIGKADNLLNCVINRFNELGDRLISLNGTDSGEYRGLSLIFEEVFYMIHVLTQKGCKLPIEDIYEKAFQVQQQQNEQNSKLQKLISEFTRKNKITEHQPIKQPIVLQQKSANNLKNIDCSPQLEILQSLDLLQEERDQIKQVKRLAQDYNEDDIDYDAFIPLSLPLNQKQLVYFLAWNQATDCTQPNLELLKQCRSFLGVYLSNLAYLLDILEEHGIKCQLDTKDIYNSDIDIGKLYDDQSELMKLVIVGLYQIIATQQGQFKSWVKQHSDKFLIRRIEEYIKVYISKAIYEREYQIIENSQDSNKIYYKLMFLIYMNTFIKEWKSDEFEIYASKNNREITAIYTKEGQKLEIALQVPLEFPLKQLKIDVRRGVKISEDKLKKWTLMIRMLLQNENDSILNGLLQWKQNIDQYYEGLEECAVCYYITHHTGELPKKACRTCKKKFHSYCIQKWFQSSNKNECPLCKSQFL